MEKTEKKFTQQESKRMFDEIYDFVWRCEQRKLRGGKFLQRELNDIENFTRLIKEIGN